MRSINGDKLYRIKVKDGAHVNNHVKEDGSKAAIQFDEENNLQGPVDLIEVDENEYIKEVYTEPIPKERSVGQVIIEDAVVPAKVIVQVNHAPVITTERYQGDQVHLLQLF